MSLSVVRDRPAQMSAEEWQTRIDLAACARLCAHYGWVESTGNHVSAKVPGEDAFLVNPYDLMFEEVTASSLLKLDFEGNLAAPTEHQQNPTAFYVHGGFYIERADIGCAIHVHSVAGTAVSCLAEGIMPINQTAMTIADHVAYHDYEGIVLDRSESERINRHLGNRRFLILRNHGTMTFGETIPEAFLRCYVLERTCEVQLQVLASGRPIYPVTPEAISSAGEIGGKMGPKSGERGWASQLRLLDRISPDYKQ